VAETETICADVCGPDHNQLHCQKWFGQAQFRPMLASALRQPDMRARALEWVAVTLGSAFVPSGPYLSWEAVLVAA